MANSEEQKFQVRKLKLSDKGKGFIELLQQLTVCDSVSDKDFEDLFKELSTRAEDHQVFVIQDDCSGKIVATGSVFIERKFIRNCGKVGHIEDVVVDANAREMQLGKNIINALTDYAHSMGCYRVILDCSVVNKAFYEKCGWLQAEGNSDGEVLHMRSVLKFLVSWLLAFVSFHWCCINSTVSVPVLR